MPFYRPRAKCPAIRISSHARIQPTAEDQNPTSFLEEAMRVVVFSLLLWAGITYGSLIMPYSILSTGSIYPPPLYDYPFPSPQVLKKLPAVRGKDLNDSLRFGHSSIEALKRLEDNLKNSGIAVERGSPEHGQLIESYPSDEALALQRLSWTITKASAHLSHMYCGRFGVPDDECASYVSTLSLRGTDVGKQCLAFNNPRCSVRKYRSFDGSCNNPMRGSWGKAMTGFKRLLHPRYDDGIEKPRMSISKKPLPPARMISASISSDVNAPDSHHTLAMMQWTQFLEHDLAHIPMRKMTHSNSFISCCDRSGGALRPRHLHPGCSSLPVSRNDPFYGKHWVDCLPFAKSATTFRSDCSFGAAEQMNQATHFLDASQVYGSDAQKSQSLRQNRGGLMRVMEFPGGVFPPLVVPSKRTERCQVEDDAEVCFESGDVRVNTHPQLTAMHVLWLREHNRIAQQLSQFNPTWNDEVLYQETRRIVIAEMQHITYSHWLQHLTGDPDDTLELSDTGYNPDLDPSVSNSFATAGLRFFNSLLDGSVHLLNENGTSSLSLEIMEHFNRPAVITEPKKYQQLIRGMITQPAQSMDLHIADDITQRLFSSANKKIGLDRLGFDIQRGRDHGLPSYNQYRALCGMKFADDFEDLTDSIPRKTVLQLKKLYANVQDVDLIVGAFAEQQKDKSLIGPTLSCLIAEQMIRTRAGDKYFYTHMDQPEPFSQQQLTQLRKTSLARVICDNVEIENIQRDVFSVVSDKNPLLSCKGNDIKRVNLAAWQDPSHKPDIITRTKMNVDKWMKNNA